MPEPTAASRPSLPRRRALRTALLLAAILIYAAALRFTGLNWDADASGFSHHLNPDERHMTMVAAAVKPPANFAEYLDSGVSPLNPRNFQLDMPYGTLPTTLVRLFAEALEGRWAWSEGVTGYDRIHLLGRGVSALFDLGTVFLVFLLGRRLFGDRRIGLLGALLYASAPLAIQYAHFFIVDGPATFFVTGALLFLCRAWRRGGAAPLALCGLFLGLALACKLSIFSFAFVVGASLVLRGWVLDGAAAPRPVRARRLAAAALRVLLVGAAAFATLRLAQPDIFQGPGLFGLEISPRWRANVETVAGINVTGEREVPFTLQWAGRSGVLFPLKHMILWGLGPALGVAAWLGVAAAAWTAVRRGRWERAPLVLWIVFLFLHQASLYTPLMRYFLPIYPALAVAAAWLLVRAADWAPLSTRGGRMRRLLGWNRRRAVALAVFVAAATCVWGTGFATIYTRPHPRVAASRWIQKYVPPGTSVANQHWDHALPLHLRNANPVPPLDLFEMRWYEPDTERKFAEALDWLDRADLVVLSSDHVSDSVRRVALRYPMTTRWYDALFDGSIGFEKVAEFTDAPRLLGLFPVPDRGAEESFRLYDHPRVRIFRKTPRYARARAAAILGAADFETAAAMQRVPAKRLGKALTGLMIPDEHLGDYREAGTWSRIFDRDGWTNRFPLLAWFLALEALGLIAFPYLFVAARGLPDRGFAFARTLGLLLTAWVAWLAAQPGLFTFDRRLIFGAATLAACGAAWLTAREGRAMGAFLAQRARLLVFETLLFWALFAFALWVRWMNPDLWHPYMGGEKPMDFAYLNATIKSAHFPPYDPWFAGGFINYYYFGFVLAGTLVRALGVVPAVAYNLLLPTFFALTGLGAFGAALGLAAPRDARRGMRGAVFAGLAAPLFAVAAGNLGEARFIARRLAALGGGAEGGFWSAARHGLGVLFERAGKAEGGLLNLLRFDWLHGQLGGRLEWWYWNPTRAVAHPPGEAPPITEFPFFTFLYGDLHPHFFALPLAMLAVGLAVAMLRAQGKRDLREAFGEVQSRPGEPVRARIVVPRRPGGLAFGLWAALTGLVVGALWPTNAWDFPTYAGVVLLALFVHEYARLNGRPTLAALGAAAGRWALVMLCAVAFFLPFRLHYGSGYTSVEPWGLSRTPLGDYLTIHGLFLCVAIGAMAADFCFGGGHASAVRWTRLLARRAVRPRRFARALRRTLRPVLGGVLSPVVFAAVAALFSLGVYAAWRAGGPAAAMAGVLAGGALLAFAGGWTFGAGLWTAAAGAAVAAAAAQTGFGPPALAFGLIIAATLLGFRRRPEPHRQFAYALIATGLAETIFVEFFVLSGDIGRMNTVFKLYLQVWVLFSIAAATSLHALTLQTRGRGALRRFGFRWFWRAAFCALLAAALLYPVLATCARTRDRFAGATAHTLDGAAFMDKAMQKEKDLVFALAPEKEAMEWMQDHVEGSPVVMEAQVDLYRWGSRYAMFTGLPAVVGWDWHQRQQRVFFGEERVRRRGRDVRSFYQTTDLDAARALLARYDVRYVVFGPVERAWFPGPGLEKFRNPPEDWRTVFQNDAVRLFEVPPMETPPLPDAGDGDAPRARRPRRLLPTRPPRPGELFLPPGYMKDGGEDFAPFVGRDGATTATLEGQSGRDGAEAPAGR